MWAPRTAWGATSQGSQRGKRLCDRRGRLTVSLAAVDGSGGSLQRKDGIAASAALRQAVLMLRRPAMGKTKVAGTQDCGAQGQASSLPCSQAVGRALPGTTWLLGPGEHSRPRQPGQTTSTPGVLGSLGKVNKSLGLAISWVCRFGNCIRAGTAYEVRTRHGPIRAQLGTCTHVS